MSKYFLNNSTFYTTFKQFLTIYFSFSHFVNKIRRMTAIFWNKRTPNAKIAAKYKSTPKCTPKNASAAAKAMLKKKPDTNTLSS